METRLLLLSNTTWGRNEESVLTACGSWHADFVYSEYLSAVGTRFRPVIWQIAEDYSKAEMLLRLPGYTPMPAFREVIDVPLVVRKAKKTRSQVSHIPPHPQKQAAS